MKQLFYKFIYSSSINYYIRIFVKSFSILLPKAFQLPPSGIITFSDKENSFKLLTNQTNYLTHYCYWNGFKNFEYTTIFIKLIKKIDVFLDVGANIGYYTILGKTYNPKLTCIAFEPANGPFYYLSKNIELNDFSDVTLEKLALSNKIGTLKFYEIKNKKYTYLEHNLAGEGSAGSMESNRSFQVIEVPTITLDQYLRNSKLKTIDLIKMDTEGTENLILENADYILSEFKPIIICETLYNQIEDKLNDIMVKYNYEFYNYTNGGLKKVDTIKRKFDNGVYNCFFVHPKKEHLIREFVM